MLKNQAEFAAMEQMLKESGELNMQPDGPGEILYRMEIQPGKALKDVKLPKNAKVIAAYMDISPFVCMAAIHPETGKILAGPWFDESAGLQLSNADDIQDRFVQGIKECLSVCAGQLPVYCFQCENRPVILTGIDQKQAKTGKSSRKKNRRR